MEAYAAVTNLKQSSHGKETAKQTVEKGNLSSLREPFKTTKILPSGGFGSIVANVNKKASGSRIGRAVWSVFTCGWYFWSAEKAVGY